MKKFLLFVLVLVFASVAGIIAGTIIRNFKNKSREPQTVQTAQLLGKKFVWGATVRPYILNQNASDFKSDQLEQQFKYIRDLFPQNACVRANVEGDMYVNDMLVGYKEKYHLQLYLILEEIKDFNPNINYEKRADDLAQRIVARYKGKVDYYQLSNELTGAVYSKADDTGEKMDAGYGLTIDKNRYEHVKRYTAQLSRKIRELDPEAKIVITGNWVLIQPILQLIKEGVDTDIIGWNWGSELGSEPAIKNIDNYGKMDIPQMVKKAGKSFMIIEANNRDGSMNGRESEQAAYIKTLAQNSYNNPNTFGYFHFILTDGITNEAMSNLGLVKTAKSENGGYKFSELKPAYNILKSFASTHY